ncbi:hypothetical protein OROMI_003695 [Orobanche minor]
MGLDSYLRIWDIESRKLLSAVFLKQHLSAVVFDSHFRSRVASSPVPQVTTRVDISDLKAVPAKRKKESREERGSKKSKSKSSSKRFKGEED